MNVRGLQYDALAASAEMAAEMATEMRGGSPLRRIVAERGFPRRAEGVGCSGLRF